MANLPVLADELPAEAVSDRLQEAVLEQIAAGKRPDEIAARIHPNDKHARRLMRLRLWRLVSRDKRFHERIAERAHAELALALIPTAVALGRQARRRPDAAKLILEASGFHSPKTQHQHSGEIKIKLDMPRPKAVEAEAVEDAEVVD